MTLSIDVLGPLRIRVGPNSVRVSKIPKKACALLAYLACQNGREVSRERLADLLWPSQEQEQARHSLRNCLLEARNALGSDRDALTGGVRDILLTAASTDIARFALLSGSDDVADLQEAAALYRGPLLDAFTLNSEIWTEWHRYEQERLEKAVIRVLNRLAQKLSAAGDHDGAVDAGQRIVAIDPLFEDAHRFLIRVFVAAGRNGEAAAQYLKCKEILKGDLGIAPSVETQQLAATLPVAARSVGRENPAVAFLANIERIKQSANGVVDRQKALANTLEDTKAAIESIQSTLRDATIALANARLLLRELETTPPVESESKPVVEAA